MPLHWHILIVCIDLQVLFILNLVFGDNFDIWKDSYIVFESCEPQVEKGGWCDWQPWSICETKTCTRKRVRHCNCPTPNSWETHGCETDLHQSDYLNGDKIQRHTRFIRKTIGQKLCKIPFFWENIYREDCINVDSNGFKYCINDLGSLEQCDILSHGMEERDVSYCDGWNQLINYGLFNYPEEHIILINSDSPLGRRCNNIKRHSQEQISFLDECKEPLFYDIYGQENTFSNLNNLVYEIENCRFACAIMKKCLSFEFARGSHCALLTKAVGRSRKPRVGSIIEEKPTDCQSMQNELWFQYPYNKASSFIERSIKLV